MMIEVEDDGVGMVESRPPPAVFRAKAPASA